MSAEVVQTFFRGLRSWTGIITVSAAIGLAGCGGGGGDEPPTVTPVPPGPGDAALVPSFDPPGGAFPSELTVSISSATPNAQIYFTTDGTTPQVGASNLFSGPIKVSASTEIKALAIASGLNSSNVVSARYDINVPGVNGSPTLIQPATASPATVTTIKDVAKLSVAASDPEGDAVTFAWTVSAGTIEGTGASVTFIPPVVEQNTPVIAKVTVADAQGNSIQSEVTVNVTPVTSSSKFNEALYAFAGDGTTNIGTAFAAFDSEVVDGSLWAASAVGDVLNVQFENTKEIFQLVLADSTSMAGQIRQATVEFSDGSRLATGALPNDGSPKAFTFQPKKINGIKVRLDEVTGSSVGLAELQAFSLLRDQEFVDAEHFSQAPSRWQVTTDGESARYRSSPADPIAWTVSAGVYRQNALVFGQTTDGFALGTYSIWNAVHTAMDLRLQVRAEKTPELFEPGVIGVMFAYQDGDNYYRLSLSRNKSYHKLEKKQNGQFTELATSTESFELSEWTNVRIILDQGMIVAYVNGAFTLAARDSSFSSGRVGVWNHWVLHSAQYDKVTLLTAPRRPVVGIAQPTALSVTGLSQMDATAVANDRVDGIEFVVDEGVANREQRFVDRDPPYEARFEFSTARARQLRAYALNAADQRLTGAETRAEVNGVAVRGLNIVTIGDSLTNGLFDNVVGDDVSTDGRNSGGGYQPVLNNLLTPAVRIPVSVIDESTVGDQSSHGVDKIASIISRNPNAQVFLLQYGTNDSGERVVSTSPGISPATFRSRMKTIVDAMLATSSAKIFIARIPPMIQSGPRTSLIRQYNTEIGSLVSSYAATVPGRVNLGPDFFAFFEDPARRAQFDPDGIHLNGDGYASMGQLWFDVLNGQVP